MGEKCSKTKMLQIKILGVKVTPMFLVGSTPSHQGLRCQSLLENLLQIPNYMVYNECVLIWMAQHRQSGDFSVNCVMLHFTCGGAAEN